MHYEVLENNPDYHYFFVFLNSGNLLVQPGYQAGQGIGKASDESL